MQVRVSPARARYGEGESRKLVAIESPDDLSADLVGHHEHSERHQVGVRKIPDFFLQGDAGREFICAATMPDRDAIAGGRENNLPRPTLPWFGSHYFPSGMANRRWRSACFDFCQNSSISSADKSFSSLPALCSSASIP